VTTRKPAPPERDFQAAAEQPEQALARAIYERQRELNEIHTAAGVPDGLTHEQTLVFLAGIGGKLDRVATLAVLWAARATQGVTLPPDYQRGRADAYSEAVSELRAALRHEAAGGRG
jgi:hypothetical protein